MKKRLFTVSTILVILLTGCHEKEPAATSIPPVKVKTMTVRQEQTVPTGSYSGTVEEENGTLLSFSTAGTVQQLYVHLGQRVKAGQLIAALEPTSLENSHKAAQATLMQAEDAYRRMKELHDKGSLPDIKWVEVQSRLEQARSMEQIAGKSLRDARLYAPFSGVIAEKSAEAGENVLPGTPVARLVTTAQLKVKIAVPEAEISSFSIGQEASVTVPALNGRSYTAKVVEKGIVAHPLSRSYDVKLRVEEADGSLLPGMVAEVCVSEPDSSTLCVIPANIVQIDEQNREFVWVNHNGKAEKRHITCGGFSGNGVVISQGLKDGDRIIVEGQHKVCNGTDIQEN